MHAAKIAMGKAKYMVRKRLKEEGFMAHKMHGTINKYL